MLHHFEFPHDNGDAVVPPVIASSYFASQSYEQLAERFSKEEGAQTKNPTVEILEQKLAAMENGESCHCFSSGMAAIASTITALVKTGDHVISVKSVCHPTHSYFNEYLPRFGVEVTFVDGSRTEEIEQAFKPNTTLIYLESPSSYLFHMQDLREISRIARQKGIITVIDNTWATPLFQNPIEHGIDLVIHSLTEYINGHSDIRAGAVIGTADKVKRIKERGANVHGGVLSPMQAWFIIRGLRTIAVRMQRHQQSALEIAQLLENHPLIERIYYPGASGYGQKELAMTYLRGFSGVMSLSIKGTEVHAKRFVNQLRLFRIGDGWGGYESAVMPFTAVRLPVPEANSPSVTAYPLVRLSIGLENVNDLKEDLLHALEYALPCKEVESIG